MTVPELSRRHFGITSVFYPAKPVEISVRGGTVRYSPDAPPAATAGRTTLLITHDLDGLDQVDQIVVLDHGRVAERGTHAELIRSGGAYQRLWEVFR